DAEFEAINEYAVCQYMKTITPAKLLRSLRDGVFEVTIPEDIRVRAHRAVERMIEIIPATARPAAVAAS
ncbi:MAG TPA: quinolinate synthase NadA, partial [Actinomycetota bacterium]|nr:quinolinate synthase NadA [Actinomycetota bacterium]